MVAVGLGRVHFSIFDVHSAYRNLRIACADWRFGIIAWKDVVTQVKQFWLDVALVFGGKSGCRIYNRFGGVLAFILRKHGFLPMPEADDPIGLVQAMLRYLDGTLRSSGFGDSCFFPVLVLSLVLVHSLTAPARSPGDVAFLW